MNSRLKTESIPTSRAVDDALRAMAAELGRSYHSQAIKQAAVLFWFSLIMSFLGFTLVAYTLIASPNVTADWQHALKLSLSVVTELVAGVLYRESAKVRQRATEFYDRLRVDLKQTNAACLVDSIDNQSMRDLIKVELVSQMAGCRYLPSTKDTSSLGKSGQERSTEH
jgi:hypothetical protein